MDSGYEPDYAHEGYCVRVLDDGTEGGASGPIPQGRIVTGWRAACECGWRGARFYARVEWPHDLAGGGFAPDALEVDDDSPAIAEWEAHVHDTHPTLAIRERARAVEQAREAARKAIGEAQEQLDQAVAEARARGASWASIGAALGISRQTAHERWSGLVSNRPS